jgi:hypothetical protein
MSGPAGVGRPLRRDTPFEVSYIAIEVRASLTTDTDDSFAEVERSNFICG